ncbi:uncharacterized protein CDAR_380601 [Caerostris darwini]|uniref:Matrix-remodeling-associated protein 7 helical domain-containing protein n=1 Tax=Caerostris darwini TaxID=1538125 RepID=A0AAV4QNV6_9ARAC|nr:uncharacterized protein CDAR_380601 [Caerostris darwini]
MSSDEKDMKHESTNRNEKSVVPINSNLKKSPAIMAEKIIEANMTDEQRNHEYEIQQKQLAQIFELMQKQSEKFGNISFTEVKEQFKLYQ